MFARENKYEISRKFKLVKPNGVSAIINMCTSACLMRARVYVRGATDYARTHNTVSQVIPYNNIPM